MNKLLRTLSVLLMAALFAPMNMQAENGLPYKPYFEMMNESKTASSTDTDYIIAPFWVIGQISSGHLLMSLRTYYCEWPCPVCVTFKVSYKNSNTNTIEELSVGPIHFYEPAPDGSGTINHMLGNGLIYICSLMEAFPIIATIYNIGIYMQVDNSTYAENFYNAPIFLDQDFSNQLKKCGLSPEGRETGVFKMVY